MNRSDLIKTTIRGDHHHFKDHKNESRVFKRRVVVSIFFLFVLMLVLTFRFYGLQISNHKSYVTQSDQNRLQVRPVAPNRGLFFDAQGRIVADNRATSILSITVELVDDINATLDEIGEIIELSDRERASFSKAMTWRRRPYQPVPLKYNLSEEDLAKIAVNEYRLKGIGIEGRLVRYYPHAELFTHVLGYVGRINERELSRFTLEQTENYAGTDSIGKIGLEKFYESTLVGKVGQEKIERDARGRVLRVLDRDIIRPEPGKM